MCDFKPGDEVTPYPPVWTEADYAFEGISRGAVYVVQSVSMPPGCPPLMKLCGVNLLPGSLGFAQASFRRVQKRSTETGMEILRKALDDASVVIAAREGA